MPDDKTPTPGEITIMAAGGVMIIFSFLDFAGNASAWGSGLFPVATLLPLYGLVMAAQIAVAKYASVDLPESVVGFTWEQLHLALGAMAALMAFGWLVTNTGGKDIGQWFLILGGFALVVGAVLVQRERNAGTIG